MRQRRTKAALIELDIALVEILALDHPQGVRQVFYRAEVAGLVPKSEAGSRTIGRRLTAMRDKGMMPMDWIVDTVRRVRRPYTVLSLEEALEDTANQYRRHVWETQGELPVIVVEKLALAGLLEAITDPWDVPLVPLQGFSSVSLVWQLAQVIAETERPAHVHYFGDWDPSGEKIGEAFKKRLYRYIPERMVTFTREAVNPEQIEEMGLPTRPTKRAGNRHAQGFVGDSVELDAIPSAVLRSMVNNCILQHVDTHALDVLRAAEESERDILTRIAERDFAEIEAWLAGSS